MVEQPNGTRHVISMENVKFVPEFEDNLFSIGSALACGWKISNKGVNITLTNDGTIINFNFLDSSSAGIVVLSKLYSYPQHSANEARTIKDPVLNSKNLFLSKTMHPNKDNATQMVKCLRIY
jgi:hypothetical protein